MSNATHETQFRDKIPYDEGTEEYKLYEDLLPILPSPASARRKLVIITDIDMDIDDMIAIVILVHMHHLGIIEIALIIANYRPSEMRAKFLRTVVRLLGANEIPIAAGTDGLGGAERETSWHELRNLTFANQTWNIEKMEYPTGYHSLDKLAHQNDTQKLVVLCLSSLQDISEYFGKQDDEFLRKHFGYIIVQGGYIIQDRSIKPDLKAMNNSFHPEAAATFTDRLHTLGIPSDAWGKEVAVAAGLDLSIFKELDGPVGKHLNWKLPRQLYGFYWDALNKPFKPHLDKAWLLETHMRIDRTNPAFQTMIAEPLSFGKFVDQTKLPAYDACAAMGALGDPFLRRLGILENTQEISDQSYRMFGESPGNLGGINPENLNLALRVFLRGSIKASYENASKLISGRITWFVPSYETTLESFKKKLPYLRENAHNKIEDGTERGIKKDKFSKPIQGIEDEGPPYELLFQEEMLQQQTINMESLTIDDAPGNGD
ncbi:hypothetical protein V2G26_007335 [Clonostachys chloroleuca]